MKKLSYLLAISYLFVASGLMASKAQVKVSDPWARPAQMGQSGAVFLKMTGAKDRLMRAECDDCEVVELHTHITEIKKDEDGKDIEVKQMRPVPHIDVHKEGFTELKKGGLHIMLLKMKKELKEGDEVKLKLIFQNSDPVEISAKVKKCCGGCHGK